MDLSSTRSLAHIDELLLMIFSYLDQPTLARAACVSSHWSDIALDSLWFEVNDLKKVLTVLAPLSLKPERVSISTGRLPGAYVGIAQSFPLILFQRLDMAQAGIQTPSLARRLAALPAVLWSRPQARP